MVDSSPFERGFDDRMAALLRPPFSNLSETLRLADVFCGIGGVSLAARNLGIEVVYAAEPDDAARRVYKRNFGWRPVEDIRGDSVANAPAFDLLYASLRELPSDVAAITQSREPFPRVMQLLFKGRPQGVIVEAPAEITFMEGIPATITSELEVLGYAVVHKNLNANQVAPYRLSDERTYFVGTRQRVAFPWPEDGGTLPVPIDMSSEIELEEALALSGFPEDWRMLGRREDAELVHNTSNSVPLVQALLVGMAQTLDSNGGG